MAAANVPALAAQLSPGKWDSDPDSPEENLRTFTEWVEEFERWMDMCGLEGQTDQQKWAFMIATGKDDMKDLIVHQAGIQIRSRPRIEAVEAREYRPAVPANADGEGGVDAQEEVIGIGG